jgi:hypothetical protein
VGEVCDKGIAADGACCNASCSAFTCATATPTPTVTHTRTPTPSRTATPTRTATPMPTVTATLTGVPPGPTPTSGGGATATPGSTTTATPIPTLTAVVTATATASTTTTATPSITATPTPISTPAVTATSTLEAATVTPNAGATATLVPTPVPTSVVVELGGLADPVAAKRATKCQQTIGKGGTAFLATRLKQLDKCTNGISKCIQTKPDDDACIAKASAKCAALRGAATAARAKLLSSVQAKCGSPFVTSTDLRGPTGIGYDGFATDCTVALGHPAADIADVAECIARRYACGSGDIYGTEAPRAGELQGVAGLPPEANDCLPDHGGDGKGTGDAVVGKAIQACTSTITKATSTFLMKKLSGLTKCVDKVFACVQTKPGDAPCLAKANGSCGKEAAKIAAARAKLGPAIDKKCGGIDFNVNLRPPRAANLDALVATLPGSDTLSTLTSYETALRLNHDCAAEDLLRVIAPRAAGLLPALAPSLSISTAGCSAP